MSVSTDLAMTVRRLAADEAASRIDELAALLVDAVANGASVNFLAGFDHAGAVAFWRGQTPRLADGSRIIFVAEASGAIVGTAVLTLAPQPNQPHRADVGKMLVHSAMRRRGLGAHLLTAVEETARGLGRTLLMLDTETGSAGDRLYRRAGWTAFGIVPGHALTPDGRPAPTTFFYKQI